MNILMIILIAICCLSVVAFPSTPSIIATGLIVAFAVSQLKGPKL